MRRTVLKSKIHRATVTAADLHYEGSLTIDRDLMDAADVLPFEQIHVWDVTNGTRLVTYALSGERGSGTIQVNGAGAHLIRPGDVVIIATFTQMETTEALRHEPTVVFVDGENRPKQHTDVVPAPIEPDDAPRPDPGPGK
ncbi:MAG: aspartate 1-decarboxylase [Fimbriiglobus sp.]